MGNYHGQRSFDTFSHERGILIKKQKLEKVIGVRYPPYTDKKATILRLLLVKHPKLLWLKTNRRIFQLLAFIFLLISIYFKKRK